MERVVRIWAWIAKIPAWLWENRKWLFSSIGAMILFAVISLIFRSCNSPSENFENPPSSSDINIENANGSVILQGDNSVINNTTINNESYDLDLGYGGLWLGYSILSKKASHPFVSVKFASGSVDINAISNDRTITSNNIQVILPEVGVEFNFTSWMRLVTHIGYREVGGLGENSLISKNKVRGVTSGLTLRFGFFR